jgi:hypothetical protein
MIREQGDRQRRDEDEPVPLDSAQVAEDIGMAALDLAERARAAGLTTIGYLLESVALEAGTQAAAARWPSDGSAS